MVPGEVEDDRITWSWWNRSEPPILSTNRRKVSSCSQRRMVWSSQETATCRSRIGINEDTLRCLRAAALLHIEVQEHAPESVAGLEVDVSRRESVGWPGRFGSVGSRPHTSLKSGSDRRLSASS